MRRPWTYGLCASLVVGVLGGLGLLDLADVEPQNGDDSAESGSHGPTIRWGGTVAWSGGPFSTLSGLATGYATQHTGECAQDQGVCDEFLLDIQMEPSPSPRLTRFVHIEMTASEPDTVFFIIVPPGGDPTKDRLLGWGPARLLDPDPGVWRVRALCYTVPSCEGATYTAEATTGALQSPSAVEHGEGGTYFRTRGDVRGHVEELNAHAFEPTLGVRSDGTIFYQTYEEPPQFAVEDRRSRVFMSTDAGDWEEVTPMLGPIRRHPTSFDPYLHVDPDTGRVFAADYGLACHSLSFTDDAEDWSTTEICGNADFQKVFTGPPAVSPVLGYPNIVYVSSLNGGAGPSSTATTLSKSLDGGRTFTPTGTAPFHDDPRQDDGAGVHGHCFGAAGPGAVGPVGTVYLPAAWCGQPYLAISHDEGATWERVQVSDTGVRRETGGDAVVVDTSPLLAYEFPSVVVTAVAADEEGNVYFAWVASDRLPYLAVSRDGGQTWGEPMMVAPPGVKETNQVDIAVTRQGEVALVYMGSENAPGAPFPDETYTCEAQFQNLCLEISYHQDPDEAYADVTWNGYITASRDVLVQAPVFVSAPVNDPTDPLVRGRCQMRCGAAGDFFDVQIAPDGTPLGAFVDICVVDQCTQYGKAIVGRLVGFAQT